MDIYQISDRYTYLKESSIKHNKNYLFSKKGQYFFWRKFKYILSFFYKYFNQIEFIYPFACRNELGIIVQKQFTLSLILDN